MHITEEFESLRADLYPLIKSWQLKLDGLWESIREEQDKNKRYSYIVEYNRFKDLLNTMTFLREDDIAVYTKEKKIKSIRHQLHPAEEYENIGTEIGNFLSKIEASLKAQDPKPNIQKLVSDIKKTINLIKTGEDVIPYATKQQLIDRLNQCIIARNKLVFHPTHGIAIQLREFKDFITSCAAICHVQCQECNHIMTFSGNSDTDIYAPIKCTKCQSFELAHYRVTNHDEFKKLDEIAEVVDENTKPGTTRAEQFRKWQAAFQNPIKNKKQSRCKAPFLCACFTPAPANPKP